MTIPASELAAWSELAEKASALPWTAEPYDDPQWMVKCEQDSKQWAVGITSQGNDEANAKYAAAAANALPRLIAAYSQSQARVAELEAAIEKHRADSRFSPHGWGFREKALWSVLPQSEGAT